MPPRPANSHFGGCELDGLGVGEQVGWIGLPIADGAAQAQEHLSQVPQGLFLRTVGPKERGQRAAPVGAVRLDGQVGQQGQDLLRLLELHHGLPVHQHTRGAKQRQRQPRRGQY